MSFTKLAERRQHPAGPILLLDCLLHVLPNGRVISEHDVC